MTVRIRPPRLGARLPRVGERGSVTAETAAVLPSVLLVLALLVWLAAAATAQLQCVDAARVGARALARGEEVAKVRAAVLRASPPGAAVTVGPIGDLVSVEVAAQVRPFGSLLADAPALRVRSRSVAVSEAVSEGLSERLSEGVSEVMSEAVGRPGPAAGTGPRTGPTEALARPVTAAGLP